MATETKKKLKGTQELEEYIMIHSGVPQNIRAKAGVAIIINKKWKSRIDSYAFINERIVTLRRKIRGGYMTIIGIYAQEEGKCEETEIFYDQLQKQLKKKQQK